jgi:UDP-glucose 4-epimerase
MTERVLVTGGAGFIGSVVAAQLLDRRYEVVVYDDLSHGHRAAVPPGARLVIDDVGNRAVIDTVRRVTNHPIPARAVERRPGDPAVLVASSAKIRRELAWSPRFPDLEAIVQSAWKWRRGHPDGYRD